MDAERDGFAARVAGLLGWEKRKRRESAVIAALAYAFLAALAVPLVVAIPRGWAWTAPVACFVLLAPWFLHARRWRERDTVRALASLDRALGLDERVTTAWDLVRRGETMAVARLVLRQAGERVKDADVRELFPRKWDRHAVLLPLLLALWLALHFFEARFQHEAPATTPAPSVARELRELARRLQEKARGEGLPRTLEAGRALERIAQQGIDAGTSDEEFRRGLAGVRGKMAAARQAAGEAPFGAGASRRELEDLRGEVEAARERAATAGGGEEALQDLLAGLNQLRRQWDRQERGGRRLAREDLQAFLDKLEQRVGAELDRRALMETEQRLEELARGGTAEAGDAPGRPGRQGGRDGPGDGARERNAASTAGKEPAGSAGAASPPPPLAQGGGPSRLKGVIGRGETSSIEFKGNPLPGRSEVPRDEVLAAYRRQAEAELGTETIPAGMKDAIRAYFMSLDHAN
ncbi:MAG: hypothetical protein IT529_01080 [Burkholderiales bacterium]|nr:hypothetical protein [Burkholderiales bacterium]